MTSAQIEFFLGSKTLEKEGKMININFKTRTAIRGFFPNTSDAEELKLKNFWRVITEGNLDNWNQTKNLALTRIFSGYDITKLKR